MLNQPELNTIAHKLIDLRAEAYLLNERIKVIECTLKKEMEERGEYILSGEDWEITWNMITSRRFDQKSFKDTNPEIFEQYVELQESRRFLVKEKEALSE